MESLLPLTQIEAHPTENGRKTDTSNILDSFIHHLGRRHETEKYPMKKCGQDEHQYAKKNSIKLILILILYEEKNEV
jgi:hypothetical protein